MLMPLVPVLVALVTAAVTTGCTASDRPTVTVAAQSSEPVTAQATAAPTVAPSPSGPDGEYDHPVLRRPTVPFRTLVNVRGEAAYSHSLTFEGEGAPLPPATSVIRSDADVAAFLKAHPVGREGDGDGRIYDLTLPPIDFSREQGVSVILPPQYTGAIRCEIVAIEEQPDRLLVHTVRWLPPEGAVTTADVGMPWHYVAMARTDKPVAFAPVVDIIQIRDRHRVLPSSLPLPRL